MNVTDFRLVLKLVWAHMRFHPTRMLLTLASTVAAACIVVWVVSSYDSLVLKFDEFADNYLGRYEFIVLPATSNPAAGSNEAFGNSPPRLSPELITAMKDDPAVAIIDPIFQGRASLTKKGAADEQEGTTGSGSGSPASSQRPQDARQNQSVSGNLAQGSQSGNGHGQGPPGSWGGRSPMLVGTNAEEAPYRLIEGSWINPQTPDLLHAAISSELAEQLKVAVGDEVIVTVMTAKAAETLKIVGIVEQRKPLPSTPPIIGLPAMRGPPLTRGPAGTALYVPRSLAEKMSGTVGQFDFAGVILKKGFTIDEFQKSWAERLAQAAPSAVLQSMKEVEAELDQSTIFETVRAQAYSATGISLLAALFIIFSTLSMGVDERIRQFAMLRAIAFTKAQVAATIMLESVALGLMGWVGGLLAGWGLLTLVARSRPDLFPVGSSLGTTCVLMSALCSLGGAIAAAVIPAWKVMRIRPLEGMSSAATPPLVGIPWRTTFTGLILVAVNPLLVFFVPMPDQSRYLASAAFGCTSMGIGFILLAPATILITEKLFAPVVARLLQVNSKLLATQLTTNIWRTLGATTSLTLGLGLFVAMQTWGYSMLGPYMPGNWVPEMVAVISPAGLPDSEVDAVRHLPGIIPERSLPCIAEQVKFATDVTGASVRATSSRQDNCVLVGIDPDLGLGGPRPVFDFKFIRGNRDEALTKLKQGRFCLVPDHFERETGLTIGQKFGVLPLDPAGAVVEYEIAGVVSMTGWHWMSKVGLRNSGGGRSAGLMFTSLEGVRNDFHLDRINAFWLNTDGTVQDDDIKQSLQAIAERSFNPRFVRRGHGKMSGSDLTRPNRRDPDRRAESRTTVNLRSREAVRATIRERADGIIWLLSRLPLVTILVTSLGIVNTIAASVRARRWDLGVMRAVGLTRFGLFRLILCEALLVGAAACLLSFGFGVMAGYCGTGVTRYVNVRGGQITPLIVPWMTIGIGFSITLGLCLTAALWPAIQTGRTEPLRLLQAGRTAT